MSYLLAFLGFVALIILHEAGHFAAAKAVGMRVERFSLFFGPLLVKFRRGETVYGVGPVPLGGYVKITGMNPNEKIPEAVLPRAYYNQVVWKRVVVILAGPAVNLVIAFGIFLAVTLSQGQGVFHHGKPVYSNRIQVGAAPADRYLKNGDQILAVDGHRSPSVDELTQLIGRHRCAGTQVSGCVAQTPVHLLVRRSGKLLPIQIRPEYNSSAKRMLLGVEFEQAMEPVATGTAASASLSYMWYVTKTTVTTFARIFEPKERKQLHSVVGVYDVAQQDFSHNTTSALELMGLVSLSLAVINLFPFLPLDGGHVFWAVAEKVRGRRIPFSIMERAGVIGFALILMVFVIGLSNDISTLTGPGFGPH